MTESNVEQKLYIKLKFPNKEDYRRSKFVNFLHSFTFKSSKNLQLNKFRSCNSFILFSFS